MTMQSKLSLSGDKNEKHSYGWIVSNRVNILFKYSYKSIGKTTVQIVL